MALHFPPRFPALTFLFIFHRPRARLDIIYQPFYYDTPTNGALLLFIEYTRYFRESMEIKVEIPT